LLDALSRPFFKVRKSNTGLSWVVEIIWGGETEAIDGFASERPHRLGRQKSAKYRRKKNEKPARMNRWAIIRQSLSRQTWSPSISLAPPGSLKRPASEMKSSNIGTASLILWQQKPSTDLFVLCPRNMRIFAVPNRGERNRRFWTLQNRVKSDVSSRNSQFGKRPFGRVAVYQTTNPKMRCEDDAGAANAQSSRRKWRSKIVQR
jgi:hypothetical protein